MKTVIQVQNLRCGGCAKTIHDKLNKLKGISEVVIEIEEQKISFNASFSNAIQQALEILTQLGYPEVTTNNSLTLKTKSVLSCASGKILK